MESNPSEGRFPRGTVVLVGGGPGDPGLMTSAGLAAIRGADVIVHDRLGPVELLAEVREDAEIINVGKVPHGPFTPQEDINRILIDRARKHLRVVRLKGGDNYVFGRGGEEWLQCAEAGVPVRVIPGVTSAVAVPALAGIPVTHRTLSQGFCVVGGHVPPGHAQSDVNWAALARSGITLVILMGVTHLAEIAEELMKGGLPPETPAAVVVEGTTKRQRSVRSTLAKVSMDAAKAGVSPPAVVVVGAVAGLELLDNTAEV
ncbi:MAG: uroporphyrinogen-III C-methyltransferase [Arachnia sp.]